MIELSWKFREMPDSDKACDNDKLLPGEMTLGELLFTGPEEADAIEKHTLGPRDRPRASSPMCLLTSSLCQQEGLAGAPAVACALLATQPILSSRDPSAQCHMRALREKA